MLMSMAMPAFAMGKGKGKSQKQTLEVSFEELEENEEFVLFLDAKTKYTLSLTDLPDDVQRVRFKKPKGQNKKELKFNSKKAKVRDGVSKHSLATGKAKSAFLGAIDLISFSDSSDLEEDDSDDDQDDDDDMNARLVASNDFAINVVVKQADTVCTDEVAPVCGRLSFPDEDDETFDVDVTFTNECEMLKSGAVKVSDGDCI